MARALTLAKKSSDVTVRLPLAIQNAYTQAAAKNLSDRRAPRSICVGREYQVRLNSNRVRGRSRSWRNSTATQKSRGRPQTTRRHRKSRAPQGFRPHSHEGKIGEITRQPAIRTKNLAEVTGKRLFDFEQTATLQKLRPSRFSILPRSPESRKLTGAKPDQGVTSVDGQLSATGDLTDACGDYSSSRRDSGR